MQDKLEAHTIAISQMPSDLYSFAVPSSKSSRISLLATAAARPLHHKKRVETKMTSFALDFVQQPSSLESSIQNLCKVENAPEILTELESDMIQLEMFLRSPHVGRQRAKGIALLDVQSQLKELILLLTECQDQVHMTAGKSWPADAGSILSIFLQWLHFLSLFKTVDPSCHDTLGVSDLQRATSKYQEITLSIRSDPRLLSLLEKRRGQKGFREIQGAALKHICGEILALLVC